MARKLFRFSGSCVHLSGLLVVYINGAFLLDGSLGVLGCTASVVFQFCHLKSATPDPTSKKSGTGSYLQSLFTRFYFKNV